MSRVAFVDTNVLYGAFHRQDQFHDSALTIVKAADGGTLPTLAVSDFVLAETLNALSTALAHESVVEAKEMLEDSAGFEIRRTSGEPWTRGGALFERHEHLSFVDALLAAHARTQDVPYLYSFDTGFDALDGLTRLNAATNPFDAE